MSRNRVASRESATVARLATVSMPVLDDGGSALLAHLTALVALRMPTAQDADRQEVASSAALAALAMMADGTDVLEAARVAVRQVALDWRQDAHESDTSAADLTDPTTAGAVEEKGYELTSWRPEAPDAWLATTPRTVLNDTVASIIAEDGPYAADAIRGAALAASKRLPARLVETLAAHGEATMRRHAAQRGILAGGALAVRPTDARDAFKARRAVKAARFKASKGTRKPAPGHRAPMPDSGPASATIARHDGMVHLFWHDEDGAHRTPITDDVAARMLARTHVGGYRPTDADRAADAFAYATTPAGAVKVASGSKRKRDGGVGSPTIMRGPRHDWSTRTLKV